MFLYDKGPRFTFHALALKHYEGLKTKLHRRITLLQGKKGKAGKFYADLSDNDWAFLKEIITGDLVELSKIMRRIKKNVSTGRYPEIFSERADKKKKLTPFGASLIKIFDYKAFTEKDRKSKNKWDAYELAETLGIDVCPYCNRGYTFTIKSNERIARPELDHFLARSEYPYLALSFYNLIPSCHICNSNLKHDKIFDLNNFIHPYRDCLNEIVKFTIRLKKKEDETLLDAVRAFGVGFFYGNLESFEIVAVSRSSGNNQESIENRRARKSLKVFRIEEFYAKHKDLVVDMVITAIRYDEDYIQSLLADFDGKLFRNREDVLRHIIQNYSSSIDMPKRTFSKLAKDIYEELGLTL